MNEWERLAPTPMIAAEIEATDNKRLTQAKAATMDMNGFSQANRARCECPTGFNHALDSWSLSDWITATTGELGEAANIAKKLNRVRDGIPGNSQTEAELRDALREEIADVFIYLDLLAQSQGFSLADAVREKFNKTSLRIGYPDILS